MRLSIVLVHHPVLDRDGNSVTTAITNLDLHDMARSARAYGLGAMYAAIAGPSGRSGVEVWTTAAKAHASGVTSYTDARALLGEARRPIALLFGTGWGLARSLIDEADVRLEPIRAEVETGYNHLSVRAACAISLDRLLGRR